MENWDEKKLEEVVNKKHGEAEKKKAKTQIVSLFSWWLVTKVSFDGKKRSRTRREVDYYTEQTASWESVARMETKMRIKPKFKEKIKAG